MTFHPKPLEAYSIKRENYVFNASIDRSPLSGSGGRQKRLDEAILLLKPSNPCIPTSSQLSIDLLTMRFSHAFI